MLKLPLCISFFIKFRGLLCVEAIAMYPFHEVLVFFARHCYSGQKCWGVFYVRNSPLVCIGSNCIAKRLVRWCLEPICTFCSPQRLFLNTSLNKRNNENFAYYLSYKRGRKVERGLASHSFCFLPFYPLSLLLFQVIDQQKRNAVELAKCMLHFSSFGICILDQNIDNQYIV